LSFLGYWDLLSPHISSGVLPQKESMRRLNKSRVNLKHHGAFPSKLDIESYRVSVNNFLEEATPLVFSIDFDKISLVDFVELESAKEHLNKASEALSENQYNTTVNHCSIAFKMLLDNYEESSRDDFLRSPFSFGDNLAFLDTRFLDKFSDCFEGFDERLIAEQIEYKLKEYLDQINKSLSVVRDKVDILSFDIDYPRYAFFRSITPYVDRNHEGEYIYLSEIKDVSKQDANFCVDFVIEIAIKLQETYINFQNDDVRA